MENIKDDQKIKKIKKVLNFEKVIKSKEKDNDNGIDSSKIIKKILKGNKNKSFIYDKLSFYTTNYYNNKFRHYKYNRNNKFLKYSKNTDKLKNNILKINQNIDNETNFLIYNKNRNKNSLMKNEKLKSKSLSKKNTKKYYIYKEEQ